MTSEEIKQNSTNGQGAASATGYPNAPGGGGQYQYTSHGYGHYYYHYPHRKMYRSKSDKYLGGVCGGMARYFNTDPLLVRLGWVILTLLSAGVGILGYIIFWAIVDKEPTNYALAKQYTTTDEYGRVHQHNQYRVS